MFQKQIYARLLKFCHHNEQGVLIADEGYKATHQIRLGNRKVTLKSAHFFMTNGYYPKGSLTHRKGDKTVVDSTCLKYKPYKATNTSN